MTAKLETQPGMITVWNLGVTRNFIRQQRMTNPEASSEMMQEDELARICEPKLQLSKTNPSTQSYFSKIYFSRTVLLEP